MAPSDDEIIYRDVDTEAENSAVDVAETIAELENKEASDLSTLYECVDGVLDNLFSEPPDPEAQMEIKFSYESYRITIEQDGTAKFVKTE